MQTKIRASLTLPSTNLQVIAVLSRIEILMEFEILASFFSNVGLFFFTICSTLKEAKTQKVFLRWSLESDLFLKFPVAVLSFILKKLKIGFSQKELKNSKLLSTGRKKDKESGFEISFGHHRLC